MNTRIFYLLTISLIFFSSCSEKKNPDKKDPVIFPKEQKIDNENFKGTAWLKMLAEPDSLNPMYAGNVRFEPGSRTNWHSHPAGQILIVTAGKGYYQEKEQAKRILLKGDVVKCPPNIPHWHGASPNSDFTHLAISSAQNGPTVWLEPVTNATYKDH